MSVLAVPGVRLEVDGAPIDRALLRTLEQVVVSRKLSVPAQCELTFVAPEAAFVPGGVALVGAHLRVSVESEAPSLFDGEVTAVEHVYAGGQQREVRVRGYELLHRLRKRQPVRAHLQVSLADLARELVADLGLTVVAEVAGPLFPRVLQHRQSDLDLLVELAERCGLYLVQRGSHLHLISLSGLGSPVPLRLGETLLEARIELNVDTACRTVHVTGWDASHIQWHDGTSQATRLGRSVGAEVPPARVGGSGERTLVDESALDEHHATALAQAELDRRAAQEVCLWGVARGDAALGPGTRVQISGVADHVSGTYVLTSVRHVVDRHGGFVSELSTEPPAPRARVRSSVVAPGVVGRIDDPENLGRVRATLPTYGGLESEWMDVVSVGAGAKKGLVALPDVGDQVLVVFPHADPSAGVVIGGLYGTTAPPEIGIENGAVARYTLLTPGGQRVQLDDSRQLVRLENSAGSFVQFTPERVVLHAGTELILEAPGQTIVIQAQQIDFRRV